MGCERRKAYSKFDRLPRSRAMAAVSASLSSISCSRNLRSLPNLSLPFRPGILYLRSHGATKSIEKLAMNEAKVRRLREVRAVEDEAVAAEQQVGEPESAEEQEVASSPSEQPAVTVPVSPSDTLTMYFQAEGTMNEVAIPAVTAAVEGIEGVGKLKVQLVEGIASVELIKQTTIQATGVASSLVEAIQGSGFKLQTLNLSFSDEEEIIV